MIVTLFFLGGSPAAFAQTPDTTGPDDPAKTDVLQALYQFEELDGSTADRLAEFEKIEKIFPQSAYARGVRESVAILRRMMAEEKARTIGPPKPENLLTPQDRVAELVFRLRDERGVLYMGPGTNEAPQESPERSLGSSAYLLVRLGYDAVPQLIEALDCEQFSRSVTSLVDPDCTRNILRVGDCSRVVLEVIAGQDFCGHASATVAMVKSGELAAVKRRVHAWWAEARKKGEKQMLAEGVAAGTKYSPWLAERLAAKDPDASLSAIRAGARAAARGWIRARLVDLAAGLKGDAPLAFLREELYGPPPREPRVAAARGLLRHGDREGVAAMIREWKRLPPGELKDVIFGRPDALFAFLAETRDAAAVRAIADGLQRRPANTRVEVITNLWRLDPAEGEKPLPADVEEEVESLLVAALSDGDVRWGLGSTWDGVQTSCPRVNDLAAYALVRRQGRPAAFSFAHPLRVRDAECLELTNEWRNRKGLAPLPAPAHWNVKNVDAAELRPLLLQLEQARGAAARKAAADKIEVTGLAAIPALQDLVRLLPADSPGATELKALIGRLTFRVVYVRTEVDPSLDRALERRVEGFKGKPVTERAILDLLLFATRQTPPGTRLELHVHRTGNQTGVELSFRARPEKKPQEGRAQFEASRSVSVDSKTILRNGLYHPSATGTVEADWDDLMEAIREAFRATPSQEVVIRVKWFSNR